MNTSEITIFYSCQSDLPGSETRNDLAVLGLAMDTIMKVAL